MNITAIDLTDVLINRIMQEIDKTSITLSNEDYDILVETIETTIQATLDRIERIEKK